MPHSGNTTADPESVSPPPDDDDSPRMVPALTILACANEPHRVGETALLDGTGRFFLGRDGKELDAITFLRARPGRSEPTGPLTGQFLSSKQLEFEVDGEHVAVANVGRRDLSVNGEKRQRTGLRPGDLIAIETYWLLLFSMRPASIPKLERDYPMGAFGEADRFGFVGESPAMWDLRARILFTAGFDEHALVLAESGTGKELAARAIHGLSRRARAPFVDRNAATLPRALLEAEVFGNKKDYPNPGMPESEGLLGAARGGTLFLDEIGDLEPEMQPPFLRVFDRPGRYQRLGDPKSLTADVRFVCATNKPIASLRGDFAARHQHRLRIPPLAERREDIPLLARALVLKVAAANPEAASRFVDTSGPRPEAKLDPALVAHLVGRDYPANIRELDILLRDAMASARRDGVLRISPKMLESPAPAPPPPPPTEEEVRAALARHKGNVTRAGDWLGIGRDRMNRLIAKYNLRAA